MTLKVFASMNTATDAEFNAAINQIPSTFLHIATSTDLDIGGKTGQSKLLVASIPLNPVCGDYLIIKLQAYTPSGNAGAFYFELNHGAEIDDIYNASGFTNTTPSYMDSSRNMTALASGDVTGQDGTLHLYVNEYTKIRSIRIWSGDSGSVSDYGA